MKQKTFFQVTSWIFLLVTLLHLLRLLYHWQAQIGSFAVPVWFSYVGVLLAGYLSYSAFQLGKR